MAKNANRVAGPRGAFRTVVGVQSQTAHGIVAEAGAQAFDAGGGALAARRLLEQAGAGAGPGDDFVGLQVQRFDRRCQLQSAKVFAQQAHEAAFVGAGLAEAQRQCAGRSVVMGQAQRAGAQQPLPNLQPAGQRREQALCREGQAFGEFDARGQFQPASEAFREDEGELGIGQFAVSAQQVIDRAVADAAAQAGSWLRRQFAEEAQAKGFETGDDIGRPFGHGARQGSERRL